MILRGINFGTVHGASGVQGFFGEGYPYHTWLRMLGLRFTGMTLVAKTTTLRARAGNMKLRKDGITPLSLLPDCIKVNLRQGVALNAVGLSGPGAKALLDDGRWQAQTHPFFLSFMAKEETEQARLRQLETFISMVKRHKSHFKAPFGLQLNFSCPNVGADITELLSEIAASLYIADELGVPLVPKLNILAPPSIAVELLHNPHCDGVCISNSIPWGSLPDRIDWSTFWGSDQSPLAHLGGGGLSGAPLLPLVEEWVKEAKRLAPGLPINAGGGILKPEDAIRLRKAGAESIFIGSMAFLRPRNVQRTIKAVTRMTAEQEKP